MKHILMVTFAALFLFAFSGAASASDCLICTKDSTDKCKGAGYCDGGGTDSAARKKCAEAGCKVGGTASCPSAANVKVCKATMIEPEFETMEKAPTLTQRAADVVYVVSALLRGECVSLS